MGMRISEIRLENWKNFRLADVSLQRRMFVIGPNASGKSNFLDAIRFLREISDPEGGLQRAVKSRGGVSEIRCLHARKYSKVAVEVKLEIDQDQWGYRIEFGQDNQRRAELAKEVVIKNGKRILERPNEEDEGDPSRLSQTFLEQVSANKDFRIIAESLAQIRYLHVIPQLIREPERVAHRRNDPYGSDFLEQIAKTPEKTLRSRLKKINCALQVAVPQLEQLELKRDDRGIPHLHGLYKHWRPNAGWQSEEHFSDGTLRLLGLLWGFLDGSAPLLLEEPELSLHSAVVQHIPAMMAAVSRRSGRQVFITTHSYELLNDPGIAPEETLRLIPGDNGTEVSLASTDPQVRAMAMAGLSMADAALPRTAPPDMEQLTLTLR
jgi:predicted ATPase